MSRVIQLFAETFVSESHFRENHITERTTQQEECHKKNWVPQENQECRNVASQGGRVLQGDDLIATRHHCAASPYWD